MRNFLFKCEHFGLLVQGSVAKAAMPREGTRITYQCPACGSTHLVDPHKSERPRPAETP